MRAEHAELYDVSNDDWGDLLGHLLDLSGQLVSVSASAIVVQRQRVLRTEPSERDGNQWAVVRLGDERGTTTARLTFCSQGLIDHGWVTDDAAPEKEMFAVFDRGGEREVLILLERE